MTTTAPKDNRTRDALLALMAGLFLLVRYRAFDLGLPTGGAEFIYQLDALEPRPKQKIKDRRVLAQIIGRAQHRRFGFLKI